MTAFRLKKSLTKSMWSCCSQREFWIENCSGRLEVWLWIMLRWQEMQERFRLAISDCIEGLQKHCFISYIVRFDTRIRKSWRLSKTWGDITQSTNDLSLSVETSQNSSDGEPFSTGSFLSTKLDEKEFWNRSQSSLPFSCISAIILKLRSTVIILMLESASISNTIILSIDQYLLRTGRWSRDDEAFT